MNIKTVNKAIQKHFPKVKLVKGNGYYYIIGEGTETLPRTGIYVYALNRISIDAWVNEVKNLMNKKP